MRTRETDKSISSRGNWNDVTYCASIEKECIKEREEEVFPPFFERHFWLCFLGHYPAVFAGVSVAGQTLPSVFMNK